MTKANPFFPIMLSDLVSLVQRTDRFNGVRLVQIYALRLVYTLMLVLLGRQTSTPVMIFCGAWNADETVAWCFWTALATLLGLGILRPLAMLVILL